MTQSLSPTACSALTSLPNELREQIVGHLTRSTDVFSAEQILWSDCRDARGRWVGNPALYERRLTTAIRPDNRPWGPGLALQVHERSQRANRHVLSCGIQWNCLRQLQKRMNFAKRGLEFCDVFAPRSPLALQLRSLVVDRMLARQFGRVTFHLRRYPEGILLQSNRYVARSYQLYRDPLEHTTFYREDNETGRIYYCVAGGVLQVRNAFDDDYT